MEVSATNLLQGLAVLFGVVGILAASLSVSRAAGVKANLELLRGEVADLTAANARLSGENKSLGSEVTVLRELVTSRAEVERLSGEVHAVLDHLRADHAGVLHIYEQWIRDAWGEDEHAEAGKRLGPGEPNLSPRRTIRRPGGTAHG